MIEPTQLFMTLYCQTPDGVSHRHGVVLSVDLLDMEDDTMQELFASYLKAKKAFRDNVEEYYREKKEQASA